MTRKIIDLIQYWQMTDAHISAKGDFIFPKWYTILYTTVHRSHFLLNTHSHCHGLAKSLHFHRNLYIIYICEHMGTSRTRSPRGWASRRETLIIIIITKGGGANALLPLRVGNQSASTRYTGYPLVQYTDSLSLSFGWERERGSIVGAILDLIKFSYKYVLDYYMRIIIMAFRGNWHFEPLCSCLRSSLSLSLGYNRLALLSLCRSSLLITLFIIVILWIRKRDECRPEKSPSRAAHAHISLRRVYHNI